MIPESPARFFAPYWAEFAEHSEYEVYLEGVEENALVRTKSGNRVVGGYFRKRAGTLLAVPNLRVESEEFTEYRTVDGREECYWTKEAEKFGGKFVSSLVAIADALASNLSITPPPNWTKVPAYRLPEEAEIEAQIEENTAKITKLEEERSELESQLSATGELRKLLYEQGKPLERAVLQALEILGFKADGYDKDGSEFDVVFVSAEGRFIGEVDGKDNKAIKIEKFSQLERNLSEDFSREEVDEHAKGVLFGNAFRLSPLADRETAFTAKCQTAASRLGVALVKTADLFEPCRYLKQTTDKKYAKACRKAISRTKGDVVIFPNPPVSSEIIEMESQSADENGAPSNRSARA